MLPDLSALVWQGLILEIDAQMKLHWHDKKSKVDSDVGTNVGLLVNQLDTLTDGLSDALSEGVTTGITDGMDGVVKQLKVIGKSVRRSYESENEGMPGWG